MVRVAMQGGTRCEVFESATRAEWVVKETGQGDSRLNVFEGDHLVASFQASTVEGYTTVPIVRAESQNVQRCSNNVQL